MSSLGGERAPLAISGVGLLSAAGAGLGPLVHALREGRDCLGPLTHFRSSDLPVNVGGEIPERALRFRGSRGSRAARSAMAAIGEAIDDANRASRPLDLGRTGLSLGTIFGAIEAWEPEPTDRRDDGENPIDALARELETGIPLGGPKAVFSMACTSGLCAFEQAACDLALGRAEAMVVGAVDTLGRVMQSGFCAIGSLGPRDAKPGSGGLLLGEAASFVVLEPLKRVLARAAQPKAILVAQRLTADGLSVSAPDSSGRAMARAITKTLEDGGVVPNALGAVTVTAATSPASALMLRNALALALGPALDHIPITSYEPAIGHVLGATSVVVLAHAGWLLEQQAVAPLLDLASGRVAQLSPVPLPHPSVLALNVGFGGFNGAQLIVRASAA